MIWHFKTKEVVKRDGSSQKTGQDKKEILSRVLWKCLRRKAIDQSAERPFVPEE